MKKYFCGLLVSVFCVLSLSGQSLPSISILGDSYSTFQGYLQPDTNAVWYVEKPDLKKTDVTSVHQTWWHILAKEAGFRLCVNNSFSGATISYTGYKDKNGRPQDYTDRSFITRASNLGCPDIIFVFGGTNDSWAGAPIGDYKYSDWTRRDLFSFRPALACLFETLTDHYPHVKIYFLLNDGLKSEINESVKTICAHYGIGCVELAHIDKLSGHPSVKGMKQISDQVRKYLSGGF